MSFENSAICAASNALPGECTLWSALVSRHAKMENDAPDRPVCRCPDVSATVVPKVAAPAVRESLRLPNASREAENVQGDLRLLVARERLIGDQGEDQFGEGWHDDMIAVAVSAAPRSIAET